MKSIRILWSCLLDLIAANLLALSLQYVSLKSYQDNLMNWVAQHAFLYALSALILFFIILGLDALFDNTYFAVVLACAVIGILDITQYKKLKILGEPVYPWDLNQMRNLPEMVKIAREIVSPGLLITVVVLLVLILVSTLRIPRAKKPVRFRIAYLSAGVFAVFFCMHLQSSVFAKPLTKMGAVDFHWDQKENYLMNGFMIAFLQNIGTKIEKAPSGYSEAAMQAIVQKYAAIPGSPTGGTGEKPNIVYVMDESLFDPTRLSNISFSDDPLKNFHQYQGKYPAGWALSPMFGGGTSNVEFEALTGLSMSFVNEGSVPYQQVLVKQKTFPSIVSVLKSRGYDATAIHPFDGTFYNRNQVYPVLGFDRFITQKEMTYKDTLSGYAFISDMSAVKQAVDVLNAGDQPHFIHLVTMQNHMPIQEGMNGPNTIAATGLQDSGKVQLESYSQSAKETDKAIRYLVDSIQLVKRPTIVLVFGDHLPALESTTFDQGWGKLTDEKRQQLMHETPLLVAANFPVQGRSLGTVSPSFFGPLLFQLAGLEQTPYYRFLEEVKQQLPGVTRNVYLDKNQTPLFNPNEKQEQLLHDYELLQFDLLYGKGYAQSMMQ